MILILADVRQCVVRGDALPFLHQTFLVSIEQGMTSGCQPDLHADDSAPTIQDVKGQVQQDT